jgi:hypothetical protein
MLLLLRLLLLFKGIIVAVLMSPSIPSVLTSSSMVDGKPSKK